MLALVYDCLFPSPIQVTTEDSGDKERAGVGNRCGGAETRCKRLSFGTEAGYCIPFVVSGLVKLFMTD